MLDPSLPLYPELLALAVFLTIAQSLTFRVGPTRRSSAQPLVFLSALILSVPTAAALVFTTHVVGRFVGGLYEKRLPPWKFLVASATSQVARVVVVGLGVSLLADRHDTIIVGGGLAAVDLVVAFALWFGLRQRHDRRAVPWPQLGRAFAEEGAANLVGLVILAASPQALPVLIVGGLLTLAIGQIGRSREQVLLSERHLSSYLTSGQLVTTSNVESFLESFGESLRKITAWDGIELILSDEEGRPSGAWRLSRAGLERRQPPEHLPIEDIELAVDTKDSFIPAAFAMPGPLSSDLTLPVVDGRRILGTLRILSPFLPTLPTRTRDLLESLLHHAVAVLRSIRLQRLATTDPMTGLAIRRLYDLRMSEMIAEARLGGRESVVVLIDVDHFKNVNDSHGHPVGDQVLQMVAAVLEEAVRRPDLAARIGGEEFALLLEGVSLEDGARVAERVRETVEALRVELDGGVTLSVTASFGVVAIRGQLTPHMIYESADRALYRAKEGGRNQVVVDDGGSPPPA